MTTEEAEAVARIVDDTANGVLRYWVDWRDLVRRYGATRIGGEISPNIARKIAADVLSELRRQLQFSDTIGP